jgi:type IV secretory pathway VirB10-like protein
MARRVRLAAASRRHLNRAAVNDGTGRTITSIQPTLTIRPGFPMRVMVSKDLVLQPYQPLFFQRGALP